MRSNKLYLASLLASSMLLAACGVYDVVPPNTQLIDRTYSTVIPHLKPTTERIVRVRCYLSSGSLLKGYCDASLSLGVSDIVNDLHTGLDVVDAVVENDIENFLKSRARSYCTDRAREGMNILYWNVAAANGDLGAVVGNYIKRHAMPDRIATYCRDAVDRVWSETNDNTYSGGHRCATGRVNFDIYDLARPPRISFDTYPREESSSLCPKARLIYELPGIVPDLRWGND
jgi:hypothetical protein